MTGCGEPVVRANAFQTVKTPAMAGKIGRRADILSFMTATGEKGTGCQRGKTKIPVDNAVLKEQEKVEFSRMAYQGSV